MADRTPLIAGNWKMYKTLSESVATVEQLKAILAGTVDVDIMVAPPFTSLAAVCAAAKGSPIDVGAQDLYWESQGAFTGEVSAAMLKDAGCRYVIIGHSERRQFFGETDESVNKKVAAAAENGLIPVMCIGESENERESGRTFSVLDKQVKKGLENLFVDNLENLVIAYEPIWAIGTGKTATSDQAQEVHQFLRSLLNDMFDSAFAQALRILYGGSVKPENVAELMAMPDIDGALVGGASLKADVFSKIVQFKK